MTETTTADDLDRDPQAQPEKELAFLDKPVNASDATQLKSKAISDKARALKEEGDLRAVLASPAGVRFMARLINTCGWNAPHFNPNNSFMCENAGRRSIAWQLEQWISDADLSLWIAVRRELEETRVKPKTSEGRRS